MTPLMALMHDTAGPAGSINGSILLINREIEKIIDVLPIHSYNLIKDQLNAIEYKRTEINKAIDAYYKHAKTIGL